MNTIFSHAAFTATVPEIRVIEQIVDRVATIKKIDYMQAMLALEAAHCNGCPLRLEAMLSARDVDLIHDVVGIMNNIDTFDGVLRGEFVPRFAVHQ